MHWTDVVRQRAKDWDAVIGKCEGCPISIPGLVIDDEQTWDCPYEPDNCHLTPADMTIINAMITGEWRCDTCGVGVCDARRCGTPCGEWEQETDQQQWLKAESAWTEATTCPTCQGAGKLFRWRLEQAYPVKSEPWDCYACGGTGKRQPRKKVGSDES